MKNREATVAELRAALGPAAERGAGGGVPRPVRRRVLEFVAAERKARGTTARASAATLGLHETTLSRWARDARRAMSSAHGDHAGVGHTNGGFRAVCLAEPTPALAAPSATGRLPLRVAHPRSGLVIDGLDVEMLASLLRSLS
jgi:hypothetical protein